jgi:platelet glycoprotein-5
MAILKILLILFGISNSLATLEVQWNCTEIQGGCIFFSVIFNGHEFIKCEKFNSSLERMIISSEYLKKIPTVDFRKLQNFKYFELVKSGIEELTAETLKFGQHITEIRMSQNEQLRRITSEAFSYQQNLTTLHIQGSNLTEIDPRAFGGLYNLTDLNLRNNQIENLHEDLFASLRNLTNLALSDNKIKILLEYLFRNNKKLEIINFSNNSVVQAYSKMFKNLTNLTQLNLMDNDCVDQDFKNASEIQRGIAECHLNIYQDGTPKPNTFQPTSITALIPICPIILVVIIILLILITHLILRTFKVVA